MMLMTLPFRSCCIIRWATCLVNRNAPVRMTSVWRRHSSTGIFSTPLKLNRAAPFTRMSTPPNRSAAWAMADDHLGLVGHVADYAHGVVSLGDDGGGALLRVFLAYIDAHQVGAGPGQLLGDAAHDVRDWCPSPAPSCPQVSRVRLQRFQKMMLTAPCQERASKSSTARR